MQWLCTHHINLPGSQTSLASSQSLLHRCTLDLSQRKFWNATLLRTASPGNSSNSNTWSNSLMVSVRVWTIPFLSSEDWTRQDSKNCSKGHASKVPRTAARSQELQQDPKNYSIQQFKNSEISWENLRKLSKTYQRHKSLNTSSSLLLTLISTFFDSFSNLSKAALPVLTTSFCFSRAAPRNAAAGASSKASLEQVTVEARGMNLIVPKKRNM